MPQDNVEQAKRLAGAFNSRDRAALCELLAPDVVWIPIMAVLEGRVYHGHAGVMEWIEHLETDWEYFETHQEEWIEVGNRVLILGRWRARARASGIELENQPASWVMDMENGRITRLQTFTDRNEALEEVGIRE